MEVILDRVSLKYIKLTDCKDLYKKIYSVSEITSMLGFEAYKYYILMLYNYLCIKTYNHKRYLVIRLKDTSEVIGFISVRFDNGRYYLGYGITTEYQHNGYMSECVNYIVNYLTNVLHTSNIFVNVLYNNSKNIEFLKKHKFKLVDRNYDVLTFTYNGGL